MEPWIRYVNLPSSELRFRPIESRSNLPALVTFIGKCLEVPILRREEGTTSGTHWHHKLCTRQVIPTWPSAINIRLACKKSNKNMSTLKSERIRALFTEVVAVIRS